MEQSVEQTKNEPHTKNKKWHYLYYVLAAVDLLTITGSLMLNHSMLDIYRQSLVKSEVWIDRANQYDKLASLAGEVNAPGNDVFDSRNFKEESQKLDVALSEFEKLFQSEMSRARESMPLEAYERLNQKFVKIESDMKEMVVEAKLIFNFFSKNQPDNAGSRMATMDHKYGNLNRSLNELRLEVRNLQAEELKGEQSRAESQSKLEYLFGVVILVIVVLVTWYGHMIATRIKETDALIESQQSQLISSSKLAALGTMSAGIAHEINNPLAVIQGFTQQIQTRAKKNMLTEDYVLTTTDKIVSTCKRISAIVRGLRTFARAGEKDPFEKVKIKALIDETIIMFSEKLKTRGIEFKINEVPDVEIECRQIQISQVIVNLVNNSIDEIEKKENPWIKLEVEVHTQANRFKILITDSGPGISQEVASKIMNPFFTTKDVGKGTGLGLSISLGIIKEHFGSLYYNPQSAHTQFVIEAPIVQNVSQNQERLSA